MADLGRIAIIANPTAQSGACAHIAEQFSAKICEHVDQTACKLVLTEHPGHAIDLAYEAKSRYDTLIVIGGDGIVNEAANGLMCIPEAYRPRLAVVPVGSGNDYALTLGMSSNIDKAMHQILECRCERFDVGKVNDKYFVETLSFGLDAAIALDTMERRRRTGKHGTILYMESGLDQIMHHLDKQTYYAEFIDVPNADEGYISCQGQSYTFAVQIGKTYGGHFEVCPDANPQDGYFDICIAHPPITPLKAVGIFMLARFGKHTGFKIFEFLRARALVLEFEDDVACQADGEPVLGRHFEVITLPGALEVVVGDYKA